MINPFSKRIMNNRRFLHNNTSNLLLIIIYILVTVFVEMQNESN